MLAACLGLALANAVAASSVVIGLLVAAVAVAVGSVQARFAACALAFALTGWLWGTARLDAFDRSLLAPEIGRGGEVTAVVTGPVRRTRFALRVPAEVRRFRDRGCTSGSSSSCRSAARRRRAPSSRSGPRSRRRAAPTTASTNAAGSRAAVSTSSSRAGTGGSSAAVAASAASRIGCAHTSRARSPPASPASAARCWPESCSARTRGLPRSSATTSRTPGLYHLLAVSGQNITFLGAGRARARLARSGFPGRGEVGGARRDRRLRARGRLAAIGRAGRCRR